MSRNISVSDDVYDRLRREKDGRSFSEVISDMAERGLRIRDVAGEGILDEETFREVKGEVRGASRGTLERLDEAA